MLRKIKVFFLSVLSIGIGMKVTLKSIFAPSVTLNYPRKKQAMKNNFRGMVDLVPPACVICYQCIKICPTAALELSHKQTVGADNKKKLEITRFDFNAELCCFCGLCEEICPTDAIFLNKMYEASAYSHDQLIRIDLMRENKYEHINPDYDFAKEALKVAKPPKPAAPAAVAAPAASAAPAAPITPAANTQPKNPAP